MKTIQINDGRQSDFDYLLNFKSFVFRMKRILAISLLIIFVSGQVNLTWADHFCMSFKVKSALMLGHDHLDCGMGEMMECEDGNSQAEGPVFKTPNCCSNDYYSSDSDDHFNKSESISGNQIFILASFVEALISFSPENDEHKILITSSPPLIHQDYQVMYQSFLL